MQNRSQNSKYQWIVARLIAVLMVIAAPLCAGCAPRPLAPGAFPGTDAEMAAEFHTLNDRVTRFDADNRELHTQVAQLQQALQISEEENRLIKQQLADASRELETVEVARREADTELSSIRASSQMRGGATITANSSLRSRLQVIDVEGIEVRLDGDVVRIELPADRLFTPGTTQMPATGMSLLDQVGQAIRQNYARQMIGIEGHTDTMTASRSVMTAHELTASQSLAVFHHLSRTNAIPAQQMFTMGVGANRPRFSNGEAAGRARNRRLEIVIYPETYDPS